MKLKRIIAVLSALAIFSNTINAQAPDDPKHENHYKPLDPIQTEYYTLEFADAHSQQAFSLIKVTITNKSYDYIFFNPNECTFKFEHGDYKPSKKEIIVKPKKSKTVTLKVAGGDKFHVEKYTLELGGFSILPTDVAASEGEQFQVPANTNNTEVGAFKLKLLKAEQETQETFLQFSCTYTGSKIGIVDPSNIVLSTEKGDYANDSKRSKPFLLQDGKSKKIVATYHIEGKILDMQFATMHLLWKETFKESSLKPQEGYTFNMILDPGLTNGKNQ